MYAWERCTGTRMAAALLRLEPGRQMGMQGGKSHEWDVGNLHQKDWCVHWAFVGCVGGHCWLLEISGERHGLKNGFSR